MMNIWSWLRLRGTGATRKDFLRSKDVHYIPRLLLTNLQEFRHFDEVWEESSFSFSPCGDLHAAFETGIQPFESYEYDPQRFVHSMPGPVDEMRVAFSGRRILTKHARLHQLLYFKDQLVLVDAKINSMALDGTIDGETHLATPVGSLSWPNPTGPSVPVVQGFRDALGRRLSLHNEVNLHLRFLVNPALFKELVQAAAQSLTTKGIGAKPF